MKSLTLALALSALTLVRAPPPEAEPDWWGGVGSASFYWHNRYHGLLAMASYGDYNTTCRRTFTAESLDRQYPGNTEQPFQVVGTFGPTPRYKQEGFMVRVPEMNKILMIFKGQYGWQNYNATLMPFLGIGCDATCQVHTGAWEAWQEVKAETNDMEVIKGNQGNLVWSASGHGFGGMVVQVAALDLKARELLFSAHSFGAAPVFNAASANRWDRLFIGDATQRTVANEDSIPASIPLSEGGYSFVSTGIHVFGTNPMYGQDFRVCDGDRESEECAGGNNPADHYFYYTDIGHCGTGWDAVYNTSFNAAALASDRAAYAATGTVTLASVPNTSMGPATTSSSSSTPPPPPPTPTPTEVTGPTNGGNEQAQQTGGSSGAVTVKAGFAGVAVAGFMALFL